MRRAVYGAVLKRPYLRLRRPLLIQSDWQNRWEVNVCCGYSARNACMGSILVARLAGSQAAAMVITVTATMAMEIDVGSSGLNS